MIAVGKPYRSGDSLFVRAKLGHDGVSIMRPIRVGNALMFRGLDCEGKVVYGYPFRSGNELRVRTIYHTCAGVANPCCYQISENVCLRRVMMVRIQGLSGSIQRSVDTSFSGIVVENETYSFDFSYYNGVYYVLSEWWPGTLPTNPCPQRWEVVLEDSGFYRYTSYNSPENSFERPIGGPHLRIDIFTNEPGELHVYASMNWEFFGTTVRNGTHPGDFPPEYDTYPLELPMMGIQLDRVVAFPWPGSWDAWFSRYECSPLTPLCSATIESGNLFGTIDIAFPPTVPDESMCRIWHPLAYRTPSRPNDPPSTGFMAYKFPLESWDPAS